MMGQRLRVCDMAQHKMGTVAATRDAATVVISAVRG